MRWAIILRIWLMGTSSPGIAAGVATGLGRETVAEGAGAGAAAVGAFSRKAVMSCLVMRPPSPVPVTCDKSTLFSRAILRTSGEERTSSSCVSTSGGGATGVSGLGASFFWEGAGTCAAGADAFAGAADSPSAEIVPTMVFTCTVLPSATLISWSTPEAGAGISASTLSVEISKRGSSRWTLSPGFFNHFVMVPSKMDSPIWGIMTSVGIGSFHRVYRDEFQTRHKLILYRVVKRQTGRAAGPDSRGRFFN